MHAYLLYVFVTHSLKERNIAGMSFRIVLKPFGQIDFETSKYSRIALINSCRE